MTDPEPEPVTESQVVAVIPLRAGSRGVPGKNTRDVAGRPLWTWSLESAADSALVDRVLVTSDIDERTLNTTPHSDYVEWDYIPRPSELATATASLDDALIHATQSLPDDAVLVLLQPTVPVRATGLVDECVRMFLRFSAARSLLTANRLHYVWHGHSGRLLNPPRTNRQAMDDGQLCYSEDGSVFVVRAGVLREAGERVVEPVVLFETATTVDIDTEADLELAEYLLGAT